MPYPPSITQLCQASSLRAAVAYVSPAMNPGYNRCLCWQTRALRVQVTCGQIAHPAPSANPRIICFMTTIRVKENEPFDVALRRFKRTIEKMGLLTDLRAREFYEKPTAERKRKKAAAVKRHFKRVRSMQLPKKLF